MNTINELAHWNQRTYGDSLKLHKSFLRGLFIIGCLCTPGTNWLIVFVKRWIPQDIRIRFENNRVLKFIKKVIRKWI